VTWAAPVLVKGQNSAEGNPEGIQGLSVGL